ncbi:MAG: hypothetical protein KAI81_04920, partial [Candidatus Marinimicrobia bacterium]|nr:hypothetical protein [Candidatus Neomarinimicrobiota bacterium]
MSEMKTRLSDQAWQNWFKPVRPTSIDGDIFTVSVPNKISKEWI